MSSSATISWWGVAASLILVGVVLLLSWWQRLGLVKVTAASAARALVQLGLVGIGLGLVIADGRPLWWSWVWVAAMMLIAAATVRRRAPEVPQAFGLSLTAFVASGAVGLGVLFGFGVFPLTGRTLIPLSGMLVGNAMAAAVLVSRRVVESVRDSTGEIEARLALGLGVADASLPQVRAAIRTALIPQMETTKAVGLVALPGAMTGLILAGAPPVDAVLVQIAIMYLVLGSVAVTTVVVALGLRRCLFTPDERVVHLTRPAEDSDVGT